jgi:hypothetical protein
VAEAESEPWVGRGGVRRLPGPRPSPSPGSGEAEFVIFRGRARVRGLGRARRSSSSSVVEAESEPWVGRGGVRRLSGPSPSPSPGSGEAEFVVFRGRARARALGRARRSFLWRLRPGLPAVSLTLSSGTAVGATRAALSSCQTGQWSGEMTTITSALSTEGTRQDKVSGHLCIKCFCETVGRRGDLAKVASWRRLGLERTEGVSVAGEGPRARRKSFGVGCPCPRLGSGEARSCPLSGPSLDLITPIRPLQLCADGGYQLRLGVLGVPLIMVPDNLIFQIVGTGPPTHGVSVGAARTHGAPTQTVGPRHTRPHV